MKTAKSISKKITQLGKKQKKQPGKESVMKFKPKVDDYNYKGSNKLKNKIAIITGGDSGIGHAVALFFAKEGADIAIVYLNEHRDAKKVKKQIEEIGQKCLLISGNVSNEKFCQQIIKKL